jgi:hypothetical protein
MYAFKLISTDNTKQISYLFTKVMDNLPSEINFEIIKGSHPYYAQKLCATDKIMLKYCETNKYEILQLWCYPFLSTKELMIRLPNVTWKQIVEMSLMFHPLPESIGKWDPITLFYYACKEGQNDPNQYLVDSEKYLLGYNYLPLWIIYKFNRLDLLKNNQRESYIDLLIKVKLNLSYDLSDYGLTREKYDLESSHIFPPMVKSLYNFCGTLFTYEEYLELLVIISKFVKDSTIHTIIKYPNTSLYRDSPNLIMAFYAISNLGIDKTNSLLAKYGVNGKILAVPENIEKRIATSKQLIFIDERINPEPYLKYMFKKYRPIHNLYKGYLIDFYNSGGNIIVDSVDEAFKYPGINEFGGVTLNEQAMKLGPNLMIGLYSRLSRNELSAFRLSKTSY